MNLLVTGAAGFIGARVTEALGRRGHKVTALDSLHPYYTPALKTARLSHIGFDLSDTDGTETAAPIFNPSGRETIYPALRYGQAYSNTRFPHLTFIRTDILDCEALGRIFAEGGFDAVVHLAAQAGARHSMEDPGECIATNVSGLLNVLECCRRHAVPIVYASSSSVYGDNRSLPFRETDRTDSPVSVYAVSKKSGELLADVYSRHYGIAATGLRFFSVYGPWGRPDMAPMIFARAITGGTPLRVFGDGRMSRDFTYIDDVATVTADITERTAAAGSGIHRIYNVGGSRPVGLLRFISLLEDALGCRGTLEMLPMQPGDAPGNHADNSSLLHDLGQAPSTPVEEGVRRFADWYLSVRQDIDI